MAKQTLLFQSLLQLEWDEKEAQVYLALLEKGESTPQEIAKATGINRTTCYVILKKLEAEGLAARFLKRKKIAFQPEHPRKLEELSEREKEEFSQKGKALQAVLPELISHYNLSRGKPSIRFFEGKEGLAEIYEDILKTGKSFHLVRTPADIAFFQDVVERFIERRVKKGIAVAALTPDTPEANRDPKKDEAQIFKRHWVPLRFYNAPVEVDIYGDKVALLSFEKEAIGVILESPQIAEMFRQLFDLAVLGAGVAMKTEKGESSLPEA